jgi:hypothetical protein
MVGVNDDCSDEPWSRPGCYRACPVNGKRALRWQRDAFVNLLRRSTTEEEATMIVK